MDKIKNRLKSITVEGWLVIAATFVMMVICLVFSIGLCCGIATGNTLFGSNIEEITNAFDIVMLIVFLFLFLAMGGTFVYNLVFRKFKKVPPVDKDIVKGKIVKRRKGHDEKLADLIKKDIDESVEVVVDFDKAKKNLRTKKEEHEETIKEESKENTEEK